MKAPAAIIFDMDDTLVRTSPLWRKAETELLESLGHSWSAEFAERYRGRNTGDLAAFVHAELRPSRPLADCQAHLRDALVRAFSEAKIEPMKGAGDCVRRLAARFPLAVASGSPLGLIEQALAAIHLRDSFKVLITSESVANGKPAPDVFLAAAARLDLPAENCLVIEDSLAGVQSGLKAGMTVFAVPSARTREIARHGVPIFPSLDEIADRLLEDSGQPTGIHCHPAA